MKNAEDWIGPLCGAPPECEMGSTAGALSKDPAPIKLSRQPPQTLWLSREDALALTRKIQADAMIEAARVLMEFDCNCAVVELNRRAKEIEEGKSQ